jgi:hypothetical protein
MRLTRILLVIAALALIGACNDATPPVETDSDLRGQVVDALGQPVAGAAVVLQLDTDPPPSVKQDKPQAMFEFDLPVAGRVTSWLGSYCDGDTVRLLVDDELQAGSHVVLWDGLDDDGRLLPDDVYWFHLVTGAGEETRPLLLLRLGYEHIAADALAPQAVTDSDGRFTLPQACLPFGYVYEAVDELGDPIATVTVIRSVRVWAYYGDVGGASAAVTVDPDTGAEVTVTLSP